MKVKLNLSNQTLEYLDSAPYIQGTDSRNKLIVYVPVEVTNIQISYQLQNGRNTIKMANSGVVLDTDDEYIADYYGYIFNAPSALTSLSGNFMASLIVTVSTNTYKINVLNTVLNSVDFEAYESALEEAQSEFAEDMTNMSSAITQLQTATTNLQNNKVDKNSVSGGTSAKINNASGKITEIIYNSGTTDKLEVEKSESGLKVYYYEDEDADTETLNERANAASIVFDESLNIKANQANLTFGANSSSGNNVFKVGNTGLENISNNGVFYNNNSFFTLGNFKGLPFNIFVQDLENDKQGGISIDFTSDDNKIKLTPQKPLYASNSKMLLASDVVNDTASTDIDKPLSANQGRVLNNAITAEVTNRQNAVSAEYDARVLADNNLQSQIDALNAAQNLADIVADLTALNNLDTTKLESGDKVEVLVDSNHDNASTVYNWNGASWEYVGRYGQDSYTKSESDAKYVNLTGTQTISGAKTFTNTTYWSVEDSSNHRGQINVGAEYLTINYYKNSSLDNYVQKTTNATNLYSKSQIVNYTNGTETHIDQYANQIESEVVSNNGYSRQKLDNLGVYGIYNKTTSDENYSCYSGIYNYPYFTFEGTNTSAGNPYDVNGLFQLNYSGFWAYIQDNDTDNYGSLRVSKNEIALKAGNEDDSTNDKTLELSMTNGLQLNGNTIIDTNNATTELFMTDSEMNTLLSEVFD